jgi:hypothetical protein
VALQLRGQIGDRDAKDGLEGGHRVFPAADAVEIGRELAGLFVVAEQEVGEQPRLRVKGLCV